MKTLFHVIAPAFLLAVSTVATAHPLRLTQEVSGPKDFPIVVGGKPAVILVEENETEVVQIASKLLAADVEQVSGVKPQCLSDAQKESGPVIIVGTLGKSQILGDLVTSGKVSAEGVGGEWESYLIDTVDDPFPGVPQALVIAGSDRRGTAYGVLEISRAIGVSPWVWWADVSPKQRKTLILAADQHRQGPPSVKYRGIFINDEDWGLQPWAAKTFEPETKDIGPKTYAKVCELLLRLKANYMWPAMHPSTKAFNHYPENKQVADRYAIVMGSSHAEPMLRNNVDEWDKEKNGDWNPVTNLQGILKYWEQRTRENGQYENVFTVGMRGIHDSGMPGGGSLTEKRDRLEKVIGLQRQLLAKYVDEDPSYVPQIFCPYKEVLEIYQAGMTLPDDITIVWPDDNHGYLRQLPNAKERQRSGGHGIYYHISYWGRPHDYLWLDSTAPALIWHEMTKAYQFGARRLWVVNVGDIKPIETGMTLFLEMAWDIDRYGKDVQKQFLRDFYAQQFGSENAERIAEVKDGYYRLCAIRRPEHMGFNSVYPNTPVQVLEWPEGTSDDATQQLLNRWLALAERAKAIGNEQPAEVRDAYFQLVEYPTRAAAAMAEKIILSEVARKTGNADAARQAEAAFQRIGQLTERYNSLQAGKWQHMMDFRPRGLPVYGMPSTEPNPTKPPTSKDESSTEPRRVQIDPIEFTRAEDRSNAGWRVVEGLGPHGAAIAVLPVQDSPTLRTAEEIREHAPSAVYEIPSDLEGEVEVMIAALPTHNLTPAHQVLAAVSINEADPQLVQFQQGKNHERDPVWQKNVLRNTMFGKVTLNILSRDTKLKLWAADPGVVVHSIAITPVQE